MALHHYTIETFRAPVLHYLTDDVNDDLFVLDAPYQRQSVWDTRRRANLIRSLLMGLPIGGVIVNERGGGETLRPYAVVDGRQRIETLRQFTAGQLATPTHWWEARDLTDPGQADDPDATVTFDGLSPAGRRRVRNGWALPQHRVAGLTVAQEAELYLLVNFGGVPQTDDDQARARTVANQH